MEAIDILIEAWQRDGLSTSEVANKFSKCKLYVTCEPCIMCASALSILGMFSFSRVSMLRSLSVQRVLVIVTFHLTSLNMVDLLLLDLLF